MALLTRPEKHYKKIMLSNFLKYSMAWHLNLLLLFYSVRMNLRVPQWWLSLKRNIGSNSLKPLINGLQQTSQPLKPSWNKLKKVNSRKVCFLKIFGKPINSLWGHKWNDSRQQTARKLCSYFQKSYLFTLAYSWIFSLSAIFLLLWVKIKWTKFYQIFIFPFVRNLIILRNKWYQDIWRWSENSQHGTAKVSKKGSKILRCWL